MNRECYTSDGQPKRRYARRADAKNALRTHVLAGRDTTGVAPYRCSDCDYFHLGHYPSSPLTRATLRDRHREAIA